MVKRNVQICILLSVVVLVSLGVFAQNVNAAALGVNYYHESMMTEQWKVPYIPVTLDQARTDFRDMKAISNHVKLYMNPLVSVNQDWVLKLTDVARSEGMHVAINMQTDDRKLDSGNWDEYARNVVDACRAFNGKAQTILVANELVLHSSFSKYEVRSRVEPLINQCKSVFNGEVAYNAFWYEKEAWYDYQKPIHFMHYEGFSNYRTNVLEMNQRWGSNARIGEWGEDLLDGNVERDDWWQKEEIEKRWNVIIHETSVPVAYIFAYREPSWNGFGIIRPDGVKRPLWEVFTGQQVQDPVVEEPKVEEPKVEEPVVEEPKPTPVDTSSGSDTAPSTIISNLAVTCNVESGNCNVKSDSTSGTCRNIILGTSSGDINTFTCAKTDGRAEIYVRSKPEGLKFDVCVGAGCVSESNGFANFDPYQTVKEQEEYDSQPHTNGIGSYKVTCSVNSGSCDIVKDNVVGSCRTVEMNTARGLLVLKACEKSGYIEVYRHVAPSGLEFNACLGSGCVDTLKGFDKFSASSTVERDPTFGSQGADGVMGLSLTVQPLGRIVNDYQESSGCRRVSAEGTQGHVEARICEKDSGYELYRLSHTGTLDVCHNGNCVGQTAGFARTN